MLFLTTYLTTCKEKEIQNTSDLMLTNSDINVNITQQQSTLNVHEM